MAEHMIESRILLRYDTLSNWMASELILKPGEVAIATATFQTALVSSDSVPANTPPAVGMKVGDGRRYFHELPWVQAVAADVYNWAKQSTKPTYDANEIQGLATFVQEHAGGGGSGGGGDVTVAARFYKLVQGDNTNRYYLAYREADSETWITDTSIYIDLAPLSQIQQWIGDDLTEYFSLYGRIYGVVYDQFATKKYEDSEESGKVVTAVSQNRGLISVTKKAISLNELQGPLNITHGGTGITSINENEILVGNNAGIFTKRTIDTIIDDNTNLATNAAIKAYVDTKTAGLTGAMHYIGEATVEIIPTVNPYVDPRIQGYDFRNVQYGDVITQGYKEYVWAGGWHLLGDESSYAIRGSIVDADISPDAAIQQSKISNLQETLAQKVTIVEGKQLSTNDYTNAEKTKLDGIESGAQVNVIEHVFVNDVERPIVTVNGQQKSITLSIDVFDEEHATKLDGIQAGAQVNAIEHIFVNGVESQPMIINNLSKSVAINFNTFTDAEKLKLSNIENEAQVNRIERIIINNTEYTPDVNKVISLTLDSSALNLTAIEGAKVPGTIQNEYEEITVINDTKDLLFARIAKTGNIQDLLQTAETYITLDCGSSTEVI